MKRFHVSCFRFQVLFLLFALILLVPDARAQKLSFSNHREIEIPEYALLRIGSFYSKLSIRQSAGYRYTKSKGEGTDFLFANHRGVIQEDGDEFPLVTTLQFGNYLLITRNIDLDFSGRVVAGHYPLGTQEDELYVDLVEEGVSGILSSEMALTPFIKMFLYENASYSTDYIDTRGFEDSQGGQRYENFRNEVGMNLDWMMAHAKNMHFEIARSDVVPMGDDNTFGSQERVGWSESLSYEQVVSMFVSMGVSVGASQAAYIATNRQDSSLYNASLFANATVTRATAMNAVIGYSDGSVVSDEVSDVSDGGAPESSVMIGGLSFDTTVNDRMRHSYGFARSQRGGFTSSFEIWNIMYYKIRWAGNFTSVAFSSERSMVETSQEVSSEYMNWANSVRISRELLSFLTLNFDVEYTIRDNNFDAAYDSGADTIDVEWSTDYETWSTKLGATFAVTRKIDFTTSVNHVERTSASEDLDYSRDMFEAMFVYAHDF